VENIFPKSWHWFKLLAASRNVTVGLPDAVLSAIFCQLLGVSIVWQAERKIAPPVAVGSDLDRLTPSVATPHTFSVPFAASEATMLNLGPATALLVRDAVLAG
jgi:hypothetical protein